MCRDTKDGGRVTSGLAPVYPAVLIVPRLPLRPCSQPGCGALSATGRCDRHPYTDTRPSASRRGYGASWRTLRASVPRPALCQQCHAEPTHTLDHKVPRSAGGSDDPTNLWWLCVSCNQAKLNTHDGGFGNPLRPRGAA